MGYRNLISDRICKYVQPHCGFTCRIAYERAKQTYPAPQGYNKKFISAGIHLIKDNLRIVSSRIDEKKENSRKEWAAATFSDYMNYLLLSDLIGNILYLHDEQLKDGVLKDSINVDLSHDKNKLFALFLKVPTHIREPFSKFDASKSTSSSLVTTVAST